MRIGTSSSQGRYLAGRASRPVALLISLPRRRFVREEERLEGVEALLDAGYLGVEQYVGLFGLFIWGADSRELLDCAALRPGVQALGIAPDALFDIAPNVNFAEAVVQDRSRQLSMGRQGRDQGANRHQAPSREQPGHFGGASNVLAPFFVRKSEVGAES